MKRIVWIIGLLGFLLIFYGLGPRFPRPELSREEILLPVGIDSLTAYIDWKEKTLPVKPGNESLILWGDSVGRKTEYVLLYLHGFSASRQEGYPVTHDFVEKFRTNAYLPRLAEHGLEDPEALLRMSPDRLYTSAKEALAIARKLGEKVIVMGTSTGGTLGLMLAADFPEAVEALILYSPNIRIKNKMAPLLSGPWGLQIARLAFGGKYRVTEDSSDGKIGQYWNCTYRLEATVYLQQLLDARMNEKEFQKVKVPVFLGYYYKDKTHQDQTVDVEALLQMFDELGTAASLKRKKAFPEAGDHVIACALTSQAVGEVETETFLFVQEVVLKKSSSKTSERIEED